MTDFELLLACLLIPAAYVVIYIAGKYDMIALICKMFERKCKEFEEYQQYKELGTLEELNDELYSLRASIDFYQSVGSVTECRKAVEKQIPKKPYYEADGYADGLLCYDYAQCPICGHDFEYGINDWGSEYCSDCGQKLDWMEE